MLNIMNSAASIIHPIYINNVSLRITMLNIINSAVSIIHPIYINNVSLRIIMLNIMNSAVSIIHLTYINNLSLHSNNQQQTVHVLLLLTIFHPQAFLYPHWRMRSSK